MMIDVVYVLVINYSGTVNTLILISVFDQRVATPAGESLVNITTVH